MPNNPDSLRWRILRGAHTGSTPPKLTAAKTYEGGTLAADQFQFELLDAEGNVLETVGNKADGTVRFSPIGYTLDDCDTELTYTVREVIPETVVDGKADGVTYDTTVYTVTVTPVDDGTGTIVAEPAITDAEGNAVDAMTFENSYEGTGQIPLSGTKNIEGRRFAEGDSWAFTLEGVDGAPVRIEQGGAQVKTFSYIVTESDEVEGIENDADADRTIQIRVTDNGDGALGVKLLPVSEALTRTNTTETVTETVGGTKTWKDGGKTHDNASEVALTLTRTSAKPDSVTETVDATPTWNGDTYKYTGLPAYDADGYAYTYSVSEAAIAGYATAQSGTDFTNTLLTNVSGDKTWVDGDNAQGTRPASITVELYADGVATGTTATVTPNDEGAWTYSFADLDKYKAGEEIAYTVAEEPVAGYTGTQDGFDLTNTLSTARAHLSLSKRFVSSGDASVPFSFRLVSLGRGDASAWPVQAASGDLDAVALFEASAGDADGALPIDDGATRFALEANATMAAGTASVDMPEIGYAEPGTYYYALYEIDGEVPGITYDQTVYLAKVSVARSAEGVLAATVEPAFEMLYPSADGTGYDDLGAAGLAEFVNNGTPAIPALFRSLAMGAVSVERVSAYPEVRKTVNGSIAGLFPGDFAFELAAQDGTVIARAANDAQGTVAFFDAESVESWGLVYNEPGTYTYTIREVIPDEPDPAMEYDEQVITLTVTVAKGADGALRATLVYTDESGAELDEPTFDNKRQGIDLLVQKVSRYGGEGLEDCTYALWMVGPDGMGDVMLKEATSDANGYILFEDVSLIVGQRYYFKEVEAPEGHTVDPYRTAYFTLTADGQTQLVEETAEDGWHSKYDNIGLRDQDGQ